MIPLKKGDYCTPCRVTLERGGRPPLYVCKECGVTHGEEKTQKGLKEGESTQWMKGKCHVCGKKRKVTHYRKFGYLQKGRLKGSVDPGELQNKLKSNLNKDENSGEKPLQG